MLLPIPSFNPIAPCRTSYLPQGPDLPRGRIRMTSSTLRSSLLRLLVIPRPRPRLVLSFLLTCRVMASLPKPVRLLLNQTRSGLRVLIGTKRPIRRGCLPDMSRGLQMPLSSSALTLVPTSTFLPRCSLCACRCLPGGGRQLDTCFASNQRSPADLAHCCNHVEKSTARSEAGVGG
jgi:hypothetical protein